MSLVEYASSSEEEEEEEEKAELEDRKDDSSVTIPESQSQGADLRTFNLRSTSLSHQQSDSASPLSAPTIEKLPDASVLLNAPSFSSHQMSGSDHYSRVATARAESASRKREPNGSASHDIRSKIPRGNLPHSRNVPATEGGLLVPPQLKGRSNVVTEDIGKLFVRRHVDSSC